MILLHFSNLEHKANHWVWSKIYFLVGLQEPLLSTVKRQKLTWFRHATHHNGFTKTILQGILEGGRCHGWWKKCWMDNIKGDILAHARPAHKGLLQKRLEEGLSRIISHTAPPLPPPPKTQLVKELN